MEITTVTRTFITSIAFYIFSLFRFECSSLINFPTIALEAPSNAYGQRLASSEIGSEEAARTSALDEFLLLSMFPM
jgi:hypothetical protein